MLPAARIHFIDESFYQERAAKKLQIHRWRRGDEKPSSCLEVWQTRIHALDKDQAWRY